jgi:PAS domain S-box-containing protein
MGFSTAFADFLLAGSSGDEGEHIDRPALARRLIPTAALLPVLLGWLRLIGERNGWYGREFGVALSTMATVLILATIAIYHARLIDAVDRRRRALEKETRKQWQKTQCALDQARAFLEAAPGGMLVIDRRGFIRQMNSETERLFGYRLEELARQPIDRILARELQPDAPDILPDFLKDPDSWKNGTSRELCALRKDGTAFPIDFALNPLSTGEGEFAIAAIRDITKRREDTERLRTSLAENEVLLQEVHPRVKNNLQVISSLLELQSSSISDEGARAVFHKGQTRIRTIGLAHERVYQSGNFAEIDFSEPCASWPVCSIA